MASLPTGSNKRGRNRRSSTWRQCRQLAISWRSGTRSPVPACLPGKQRQTAVMYTRWRTRASSSPMSPNQRNRVLPAVQAKGRAASISLGPGAWPMSMTDPIGADRGPWRRAADARIDAARAGQRPWPVMAMM